MAEKSLGGFANLERLVAAIGDDDAPVSPQIDRAALLAELAAVKSVVDRSTLPDLRIQIPRSIRVAIDGPAIPVPDWTELFGDDALITGPEIDTHSCPVCKRPL